MKSDRLSSCLLTLCLMLTTCCCIVVRANSPPEFLLDPDQSRGGDIVIRLKEGPDTPPGTVIYRVKAFDPDGDILTFGLISSDSNAELVEIVNDSNEASIVLKKELDAESEREHQLVLTLTDDR